MRNALQLSFASALLAALSAPASAQYTLYVDDSAVGANDGSSWQDAYTDLQSALAVAVPINEIWVARGTYKPSSTLDRTANFEVPCDLYGGFDGTESSLQQRAGLFDETILSGDLLGNDGPDFAGYEDNSQNVVYFPSIETPILDGFTVRGGSAISSLSESGGGLVISSFCFGATVRNCTFVANQAQGNGGGLWQLLTPTLIERCTFIGNRSGRNGGGISAASDGTIRSCRFLGNFAEGLGGGLFSGQDLDDSLFSGNHAGRAGGGVFFQGGFDNCTFFANTASIGGGVSADHLGSRANPRSCIFWGNSDATGQTQRGQIGASATAEFCIVQGWDESLPGYSTFDADPLFRSPLGADGIAGTLDDDLGLESGSPCVDTGRATGYSGSGLDALGRPRFVDSLACDHDTDVIDRGAIERQHVDGWTTFCVSTPTTLGVPAQIISLFGCRFELSGVPFLILARPVPVADGSSFLLIGRPGASRPFGDGVLCLSGPLSRIPPVDHGFQEIVYVLDPSQPPASEILHIGSTFGIQAVFRDVATGGAGFNFTSALTLLAVP